MPQEKPSATSPRRAALHCRLRAERGEQAPRYTHQRGAGGVAEARLARKGEWGRRGLAAHLRRVVLI